MAWYLLAAAGVWSVVAATCQADPPPHRHVDDGSGVCILCGMKLR